MLRKSEGNLHETKVAALSCMVLHNICLDKKDTLPKKLDVSIDPRTNQKRDRKVICDLLLMGRNTQIFDPTNNEAIAIREAITTKLWKELQNSKYKLDFE